MRFTSTLAASVLAFAPSTIAAGTAYVVNNCGTDVYLASVAQGIFTPMSRMTSAGFSEPYSLPNVGVSIKLAPSTTSPVTQFEFTWADGKINYDISNIDGNPFAAQGMSLTPSIVGADGYPSCQPVICPAGEATCTAAYNHPDDVRTMVCPDHVDLTFELCPATHNARAAVAHEHSHRSHPRDFRR